MNHMRDAAAMYRNSPTTWATPRSYLNRQARHWNLMADLEAIDDLDLSDLYAPTPGDALALRGEP